jgi:hypothetical protein
VGCLRAGFGFHRFRSGSKRLFVVWSGMVWEYSLALSALHFHLLLAMRENALFA